ncbi:PTS sugar transporter subunit IIB [Acerihabitans sp. KWT182]|uniref:PTS sugar transporter subunit IIB n=1 Tax=Acerihabitans sp. KWT182 TaxID=3157919 RepID=A0AAU7QDS7_9GAMM
MSANIVLARIDDRLVHGQIMTAWVQYTSANHIVIVDNVTAKDDFVKSIIEMAVPKSIGLSITDEEGAPDLLNTLHESKRAIILAKIPQAFLELIKKNVLFKEINIGGMGAKKERAKFYKNISASEEEKKAFREIIDFGVALNIQILPYDAAIPAKDFL